MYLIVSYFLSIGCGRTIHFSWRSRQARNIHTLQSVPKSTLRFSDPTYISKISDFLSVLPRFDLEMTLRWPWNDFKPLYDRTRIQRNQKPIRLLLLYSLRFFYTFFSQFDLDPDLIEVHWLWILNQRPKKHFPKFSLIPLILVKLFKSSLI